MDSRLLRKRISVGSIALTGLLFIQAGIAILLWIDNVPAPVRWTVFLSTCFVSFFAIISVFSKFKLSRLIQAISPTIFGFIFLVNPQSITTLFALFTGLYIMFIGFLRFIDFIVLNANKTKGRWWALTEVILSIGFGLPLMIAPSIYVERAALIASFIFIFHGLTYFEDLILQIAPTKWNGVLKTKIRINLPIIFTSTIPKKYIKNINKLFSVDDDGVLIQESFKTNETPDLEIFIHAAETGFSSMGHVDIFFEGKVYSYGNYDPESWKFFESVGDGVLLVVDGKQAYIDFRMEDLKSSSFCYGLRLSEPQKERVRKTIQELMSHTYPWKTKQQRVDEGEGSDEIPQNYASRLYRATKMKSYKFKDTSFKAYFVMTTNCVKLADKIIRSMGVVTATPNGLLTPGTYLDYFDRQYRLKKSIVVSCQSYNPLGEIVHTEVR